jgi:Domain of unknown function (DUF4062)
MSVKIFLSTVSDEFREYRDQLRSDLTRHNVEVKVQEDFKDYGVVTLDKLDLYIRACDAVVHLVGDMAGSDAKPASTTSITAKYPDIAEKLPPLREPLDRGVGISYTQWEAWLSLYHGKALLIAKADDAAPRGPKYAPSDASRAAQQMHLRRLRAVERYPGFTFTSPDNLAKQIALTTILDLLAKEKRGEIPREARGLPYATLIAVLFLLLLTPLAADQLTKAFGLTFAAPISLLGAAGGLALALIYWRYVGILGAGGEPLGSLERQAYDALRASFATGGLPARLYSHWLSRFLDAVDRFFGDAGMADRTLFPHAFGLHTPAPLWTAPAFDRCLLLASVYPMATIFVIWAVSGHVGLAEAALSLKPDFLVWRRGIALAVVGFSIFALWRRIRTMQSAWFPVIGICLLVGFSEGGLPEVVAVPIFTAAATIAVIRTSHSIGAAALALAVLYAFASAPKIGPASVVNVAAIFCSTLAVAWLSNTAIKYRRQEVFLSFLFATMILACLGGAGLLAHLNSWETSGPLLLFLGLLTLLNAPFDWVSLGLTRALLRRGLELGGWWPYLLGLVDALLAAVTIAVLALTMVVGAQTFDFIAVLGGGSPVLPLGPLFDGITAHPEAPEYWWVYALLLSTMIPSLINLFIGGTALMRTAPGLPSLLLRHMPTGRAVPAFDRAWVAFVLTVQVAVGVILGLVGQAFLAVGLIGYVMPWLGISLLDLARHVGDLNLPMRVWQVLGGTLQ